MTPTVKVHLLGRDYLLRSQGGQERVQEAAILVEEKLAGIDQSVSVDTRDRFILALLNLAGEYLRENTKTQNLEARVEELGADLQALEQQVDRTAADLVAKIEDALND